MKLIAISFLNLPKEENILLKNIHLNIYFDIIKEIFNNIEIYSRINTIYIQYKSNAQLKGYGTLSNMKYYKLT